jgi:hypothetical protein
MTSLATTSRHPVLHYLAIARAARDFGLHRVHLDPLAARFRPVPGAIDRFAEAIAAALLDESSAAPGSHLGRTEPRRSHDDEDR